MADENINDLAKIKQLTSSIHFENEDVRRQVEMMLGRYQDVAEAVERVRDLTREEVELNNSYLATLAKMGDALGPQVQQLGDASKALAGMEASVKKYSQAAEAATRTSQRLNDAIKGATKERLKREERLQPGEQRVAAAEKRLSELREHREGLGRAGINVPRQIEEQNRKEEQQAKRTVAAEQKKLDADRKGVELAIKRIATLKDEKKFADDIRVKSQARAKASQDTLAAHEKLLPAIEKQRVAEDKAARRARDQEEELSPRGRRPRGGALRRFGGSLGLNVASDLGIPFVSQIAQIERYRRLTTDAARRAQEARGEEEGGGGAGGLAALLSGPAGIAIGALAAGGGLAVHKMRQAFGRAEELAPGAMTLQGQLGQRAGVGQSAYLQDLSRYGLSNVEAQRALIQANREIGGRAGPESLRDLARTARTYGLDTGEVSGQAGQLLRAGGATPQTAAKSLERIMSEGIRSGIDRARITEFTQEVIGIQQDLLKETGENNAEAIAKALGGFMAATGRRGSEFFGGPEMAGIRSISGALQAFGRGGGGPAAGAIFRALSPLTQGTSPAERFVNMQRIAEGGIFGKTPTEAGGLFGPAATRQIGARERLQSVMGEFFNMAGAGDLFGRAAAGGRGRFNKAEEDRFRRAAPVAAVMAQQQLGVSITQFDKLFRMLESGKVESKEGIKELQDVMKDPAEKQADSLTALLTAMKSADNSLTSIAVSSKVVAAAIAGKGAEAAANKALQQSGLIDTAADVFSAGANTFARAVDVFTGGKGPSYQDIIQGKSGDVVPLPTALGQAATDVVTGEKPLLSAIADVITSSFASRDVAPPGRQGTPQQRADVPQGGPDVSGLAAFFGAIATALGQNTAALSQNTAATNQNSSATTRPPRWGNTGVAVGK